MYAAGQDDDDTRDYYAEDEAEAAIARAAYDMQWPHACKVCGGAGQIVTYGVRYRRDGSGEPDTVDVCEACWGQGTCPRCGVTTLLDDLAPDELAEMPCPACGWTVESDTRP